jgi:cytochrome c heme-lyase
MPFSLSCSDANSCPYSADYDPAIVNPLNNMPPPNQQRAPDQKEPLSVDREVSTIPMGGKHEGKNWIYPSEQVSKSLRHWMSC